MAYSNSVAGVPFTTVKLIEHAFRRCKVKPEAVTAEMLETARDCLQLMLQAAVNESWPLWTQERHLLPIVEGQSYIETPTGTVDLINAGLRSAQRANGSVQTSSAGGTVANAFDDNYDTECVQVAPNGNIQVQYEAATAVVTVGVLPGASGTWTFSFQRSSDGVTWTNVRTVTSQVVVDREWLWFDLEGYLASLYFRIVASGGTTLEIRELYPATQCTEVPLNRINIDQYSWMPDKQRRGRPVNYFYDRQLEPLIRLWMVPDSTIKNYHVAAWLRRYIMDVGTFSQEIEVPRAQYEAFVWNLAWRLACEIPEVDASKLQFLKPTADEAWKMARVEGRDRSPIYFQPNIRAYTR